MILIADDFELNRRFLDAVCRVDGHDTREVSNGLRAVEAADRERFDIILMDMMMPVMNGIEATRQIRALSAPWGTGCIIGVTAMDRDAARREGACAGMNGILLKPFRPDHLLRLLRHCGACGGRHCSAASGVCILPAVDDLAG